MRTKSKSGSCALKSKSNITVQSPSQGNMLQTRASKIKEKLEIYSALFKHCQTVEEVIEKYVDYNNQTLVLVGVEVEVLRYYLQFNSRFMHSTWTTDAVIKLIKANVSVKSLSDDNNLILDELRGKLVKVLRGQLDILTTVKLIKSNSSIEANIIEDDRTLANTYKENEIRVSVIKEKITNIKKHCSHYKNLDDVIKAYIDIVPSDSLHSKVEIYALKHYLQCYCNLYKKVYSIEELKLIIDNANKKNSTFATFDISEAEKETAYSPVKISPSLSKINKHVCVFKKMRKMRDNSYYMSEREVFIKQGEFVETFSDDYNGNVPFQEYYPTYDSMNDNQLRTYFTWRTKVRNGEIKQTSLSYVFVYIYEMINNIGVKNANDGIEMLICLLKGYAVYDNKVENYLVQWIKDYYICNKFKISFKEIVEKYELESYYPSIIMQDGNNKYSFDSLCSLSKYKIEESKFFTEENKAHIAHCFNGVILNLKPLLSLYGTDFNELILGSNDTLSWWEPFNGAVYKEIKYTDRMVVISSNERYILKNGQWKACKPSQNTSGASLILGYIIKQIEANLRQLTNYRHKLSPNSIVFMENIQKQYGLSNNIKLAISDPLFHEIIDEATKCQFAAHMESDKNMALISVSNKLNDFLNEEPYMSFGKMRALDSLKGETDPTTRFCRQAQALVNLSDDFASIVPYNSYRPTYDNMTNDQLRCYFTLRSKLSEGVYLDASVAYIQLYVFELINNIGEDDEQKVIEKLALLLKNYAILSKSLENILVTCIKDYYICGDFTDSFYQILMEYDIARYYPRIYVEFSDDYNLSVYQNISSYKIDKSKFYNDKTVVLMQDCFILLFKNVEKYFGENGVDLKQVIIGTAYVKQWWRPFSNVICDKKPKSNKRVVLCSKEIYSYKNGEWFCEAMPVKDTTGANLVGYILKRMEMKIREAVKYKNKLSVDGSSVADKLTTSSLKEIILNPKFDQSIDEAVVLYLKHNNSQVFTNPDVLFQKAVEVTIDTSKLDKIRKEADETREKLIVEEEVSKQSIATEFNDENSDAEIEQDSNNTDNASSKLSELQVKVLNILINEAQSIPSILVLSQKHKILPEVILESINEVFLDLIGDNIIETDDENPFIYEEYLEEVINVLGGNRYGESSA